jgi:hypothetical protein
MNLLSSIFRLSVACLIVSLGLPGFPTGTWVQAEEPADTIFNRDIAPVLLKSCIGCHNPGDRKGDFDLSTARVAMQPGEDGPRIVPGKPGESPLMKRLLDGSMPPEGKHARPSKEEIEKISQWIVRGASWPRDRTLSRFDISTANRAGRDWWSLQPLEVSKPPAVRNRGWVRNPIDQYILAGLEAKALKPSPLIDRRQFLRRASFDLLGLPPAPEAITEFQYDSSPAAVERLVERLLASPHYGERWGRYWLDVIGFTESDGFEHDKFRPHAWRYRDYVIDSFNTDLPYEKFILQQIAGDVQADATQQSIVASGFLVTSEWDEVQYVGSSKSEMRRAHEEQIAELVGTVTGTFLGLTVSCCRCHDHKFDPLPQTDYYRVKAVFDGVDHSQGRIVGNRSILSSEETAAVEKHKAPLLKQQANLQNQLAMLQQKLPSDATPQQATESLTKGRHGSALNARQTQASTASKNSYHKPPLTVECWALADRKDQFNVFVANNLKQSGEHWELYSYTGEGDYSVYMPGYQPATIRSGTVITDGKWHYLAMQFDGHKVVLYVDGKKVKEQAVKRMKPPGALGTLDFGGYLADKIGCAGAVDEVRISASIRPITMPAPGPFTVDKETIGLWRFEKLENGRFADLISRKDSVETGTIIARQGKVQKELAALKKQLSSLSPPLGYIGYRRQPQPTHVLLRGDIRADGPQVSPGGVSALTTFPGDLQLPVDAPEAERRLKFAAWLTDPANPLPARVMVNRIWQFHFGSGLVKTASDFGFNGGKPTHPGLLDWLANELIQSGWSVKHVHRLILSSATYQQSAEMNEKAAAMDAENQLLWRFSPRRLDAEVIRDTMLAISGALDRRMRGPSFQPFKVTVFNTHFYHLFDSPKPEYNRRTIYRANVITGRDPLLDCFDCPSPSVATPLRRATITPTQALALMNNSFVLRQARLFAAQVKESAGPNVLAQLERAFQLALTRSPTEKEQEQMNQLVSEHGLASACWVLLNSSEFLYSN